MPSRGKKYQDNYDHQLIDEEESKRASSFLPMRGRKDDTSEMMEEDKRNVKAFFGMRGKKNQESMDDGINISDNIRHPFDLYQRELDTLIKKASFMPSRGRKNQMQIDDKQYYQSPIGSRQTQHQQTFNSRM